MGAVHLSSYGSSQTVNSANGDVRSFRVSAKHTFRHRWKEALDYGSRTVWAYLVIMRVFRT